MSTASSIPNPTDYLAVRSRVSWPAIFAGAMVALSIYVVLTLLGLAFGLEAAARGTEVDIGAGAALYAVVSLLISFFFGGWATSRLAVGESKLEAVLYGLILWGLMFLGLFWLVSAGVRAGFSGMVGVATGAYGTPEGGIDVNALTADLKEAGVPAEQVDRVQEYYAQVEQSPGRISNVAVDVTERNREAFLSGSRVAARWSLVGVLTSLGAVVVGSLVGSGDLPVPVPIIGVKRRAVG